MSAEKYLCAKELIDEFDKIGVKVSYNHIRNLMLISPCCLSGRFARFNELHEFWRSLPPGTNLRERAKSLRQVKLGKIHVL